MRERFGVDEGSWVSPPPRSESGDLKSGEPESCQFIDPRDGALPSAPLSHAAYHVERSRSQGGRCLLQLLDSSCPVLLREELHVAGSVGVHRCADKRPGQKNE